MNQSKGTIGFYIGNMNRSGGTERVLAQITSELIQRNWKICILNMYGNSKEESFYPFSPKIKKIWLMENYPSTPKEHLQEIRNLHACLKREHLRVLIELDLILSIYTMPARIGCGVKIIAWEHFNFYYQYRKHNRLHRIGMWLASWNAQKLVVLTKEDAKYYKKHFPWVRKKICQIYNPNSYQVTEEEIPEWKERKKVVMAAGRLTPAKGFSHLIESWRMIEREFPEWELVIAGEGELHEQLEQQVHKQELQHIKFLGNVKQEEMKELYKTVSVFAFPSIWEGFGLVLTEAMNYGLPCVAFACKAGPKDILEGEQGGFLVTTGDEESFANRLRQLMRDPLLCETMGKHAKDSCRRFDPGKIADIWETLLREFYR